jgi:checkpoint serine/threonine-protein kinase
MTLHTKEAMDDIYEIFNQPLKNPAEATAEPDSGEDSSDDDDYTSGGESTGTGGISGPNSEFGDETTADFTLRTTVDDEEEEDEEEGDNGSEVDDTDIKSVSEWSEFTESRHVPQDHRRNDADEDTDHSIHSSGEPDGHDSLGEATGQREDLVTPTSPDRPQGSLPTRYIPMPPEDFNVPTQPYRHPSQVANNRLPFMTPIVEKTESSIGIATVASQKDFFAAKTPSRSKGSPAILEDEAELWSSPFREILDRDAEGAGKVSQLALREAPKPAETTLTAKTKISANKAAEAKEAKPKGPIIQDAQCNPVDEAIRETILCQIQPPLKSYDGYFEDKTLAYGKGAEIRKFTKALSKKGSNDRTSTNISGAPILKLDGSDRTYTVKRELGKGAFAPVYLVESTETEQFTDENRPPQMGKGDFGIKRHALEAVKMEEPPSAWEFYIMRQARRRLGVSRAGDSIIDAYEMHMYKDECYLVEEFREQGTLLDLVNLARAENGVMDEQLAMFFTVELFRTVEALHSKGLIHGDIKADNVLVRFNALPQGEQWDSQYHRDGRNGWASKGIALIDFGRGIDMKAFKPDVQFIADWETSEQDCAEMRELRPWTYQIDYHGLAGIVHNLLFGKYISTIAERGGTLGAGATKTYRIRESLKRYWQTDIWNEVIDLLLNPLMHLEGEEGRKLPVLRGMKAVREKMETYLEGNCNKDVGLKALVRRMEDAVNHKRR